MTANVEPVDRSLGLAHRAWLANPPHKNSPQRTQKYQEALRDYLVAEGFTESSIKFDYPVPALFSKSCDLVYAPFLFPRLAVSLKIIPLHELSAHARTRLEEATGDAANIHGQYPELVLGYLWILPVDPQVSAQEGDWAILRDAVRFLSRLAGRAGATDLSARYEAVGVYVCSWAQGQLPQADGKRHNKDLAKIRRQIPTFLTPAAMGRLLVASYRQRFGELHEPP